MLSVSYCVSSQEINEETLLIKKRNEAFSYYNDSYKRRINKEVYIQEIRQPEVKQIVVNNYYVRDNRGCGNIVNYGYFGNYYRPYNYVIPIVHIGGHRRYRR